MSNQQGLLYEYNRNNLAFLSALLILSCEKKDDASSGSNLPSKFKVDIPSSVSSSNSGNRIKKSDEIDGAVAYAAIPH